MIQATLGVVEKLTLEVTGEQKERKRFKRQGDDGAQDVVLQKVEYGCIYGHLLTGIRFVL